MSATPIAVFCMPLGTTSSTWDWMRTVVRGIQRKLLPNQKALSAVCWRFPYSAVLPSDVLAVAMAEG